MDRPSHLPENEGQRRPLAMAQVAQAKRCRDLPKQEAAVETE